LFHRAILQSGATGLAPPTRADATAAAQRVLAELGVSAGELADVSTDRLLAVQAKSIREQGLGAYAPYVDGVSLPEPPLAAVRSGTAADVPLLLGSNRDEWALFDMFVPDATRAAQARLRERLGATLDAILPAYRGWVDLIGDVVFRLPMIRLAEAQRAPVYMYRFDVASPAFEGKLGAAHALELPFVWNRLDQMIAQLLLGGDVTPFVPLALQIHDTWAAFIKGGEPAGGGLPPWPRYEPVRRATLVIDRESRVVDDPDGARRSMWPA
jgi:para-nitrobenzyl esterase